MSENETAVEGAEAGVETAEQPGVATFTTKADKSEGAREITISWPLGKTVAEMVEKFGETVVYGMAEKALVIAAQANIRRMLSATKENSKELKYSDEDIKNYVFNTYKPGVRVAGEKGTSKSSMEKMLAYVLKLSPEDRAAFIDDPAGFMASHK